MKLSKSPAYAAALILHPRYRMKYFEEGWKGPLRKYLDPMKKAVRKLYNQEYRQFAGTEFEKPGPAIQHDFQLFDNFVEDTPPSEIDDEYLEYVNGQRMKQSPSNLYGWWGQQDWITSVQCMAFDFISIPVMRAEVERVFSEMKHDIDQQSNRLGPDIIEALECERRWMKAGI